MGHSPGPSTRYEWNPSPYTGQWGGQSSYGRGNRGWGYPGGGYYPGGSPFFFYINPPIFVGPDYGYGYGYSGQGWGPSSASYGYVNRSPFIGPDPTPGIDALPPIPVDADVELGRAVPNARARRPLAAEDRLPVVKPSTPEQQQRSLRHMATGDQQLKNGRYLAAAQEYRQAIRDAEDLSDNYFRLGFALAANRRYDEAVNQFKYGLLVDPTWPQRDVSLTSIFGDGNQFEKTALIRRTSDWVRRDVRDPDRIFLLAVFLYCDGDQEKADLLFDSAIRVAGEEPYLTAFVRPEEQGQPVVPAANEEAQPPVPNPPPANVAPAPRKIAVPSPPADETQPVPQRSSAPPEESDNPEKFPDLKVPSIPGEGDSPVPQSPSAQKKPTVPASDLPALPSLTGPVSAR